MQFSIVIVNYNGSRFLTRCIESILSADCPRDHYQVIVADNGSTDGSVELVRAKYPTVKVLESKTNLGFAMGTNLGANIAQGKYIVFLNNDTICSANWLAELSKGIEKYPAAIYTGKLLMMDGRINSAGGMCDKYGFACDRGIFEQDVGQYDKIEPVFFGCGALLVVRREVWEWLGGFDERFFIYYEDCDLCWRARLRGISTVYLPEVIVYHEYGATIPGGSPKRYYLRERNRLSAMIRNLEARTLLATFPPYVALKLAELTVMVLAGNMKIAGSVVRAMLWNLVNIGILWRDRGRIQANRIIGDPEIVRAMVDRSIELNRFRQGFLHLLKRSDAIPR